MCRLLVREPETRLAELFKETVFVGARKKRIYPRSIRQRDYCAAVRENDLVFGIGPAGTGKTYLAMALALAAHGRKDLRRVAAQAEGNAVQRALLALLAERVDLLLRSHT